MLHRLLREPLTHFFGLALAIFLLYGLLNQSSEQEPGKIVVTAPKIAQITEIFTRTWQRPPSDKELKALVDDYVDEEIYVREAMALGLDQDDTVIRRRLRQKMEFLQDTEVDALAPADADLAAYLAAHPGQFAVDPQVAFEQIFLSPDKRGKAVMADAQAILAALAGGASGDAATHGDPSLLPAAMELTPLSQIGKAFGADFAEAVAKAPAGTWSVPIVSAYGVHLVRVSKAEPGRVPQLEEVRADVLREWTNAKAAELAAARLAALRARYQVMIEPPGAAAPAP